jgi:hypothetical protein
MLEVPASVENPATLGFWILAAAVLFVNFVFFGSLVFWTVKVRRPIMLACCFFLSHTAVGTLALPVILSARGEMSWYLSLSLVLIDWPIAPYFDSIFEGPVFRRVTLYMLFGGGVYATVGFLVGLIASLVRQAS